MTRRGLAALLAAGCGASPPPATPAPPPSSIDAGVADAPDGDPAMAEILGALRGFQAEACACTTAACGEEVEAAQVQWGFDHRELLARSAPTEAQQREAQAVIEATEACLERWH